MKRRDAIKSITAVVGTAAVATSGATLLNACKEESYKLSYANKNLPSKSALLVQDLSDIILPPTDKSPGARDVKVPEYIDMMIGEVVGEDDKKNFNKGAELYWKAFKKKSGSSFDKATPQQKSEFLMEAMQESAAHISNKQTIDAGEARVTVDKKEEKDGEESKAEANNEPNEQDFFLTKLKELTMEGFYNSKEIMTKQFVYDPIPGHYSGCVDLQEATKGKAWAL